MDVMRSVATDCGVDLSDDSQDGFCISVSAERALALLTRLREEPESSMRRLVDLTAIDLGGASGRFDIVYWLHSSSRNESIRVRVRLESSSLVVDSVVDQWPGANWLEREVFDLFGIDFRGHPDLRRILLDPDSEGAPLRKDYPRQPHLELPKAAKT